MKTHFSFLIFSFLIFHFSFFTPVQAQTDWKKVQKLLDDGSYKTAYGEAEKVYKKTQNSSELLTAAWYMMKAATWYQEDAYDSSVARYRAILPRLEAPERAVCYALLEEADSALLDEELLKQTPAERIRQFCTGTDSKAVNVTPTVFDVVAQMLLSAYVDDRESLLQKLIDFHKGDNDDIRIWLDLKMISILENKPNHPVTENLYKSYIDKYRASTCVRKTRFYSMMASYLVGKDRHEEALCYCDSAIAIAPKSEGGAAAQNLRNNINRTEISFTGYSDNSKAIPGRPSLHKLRYRNASRLYFGLAPYKEDDKGCIAQPKVFHSWEMAVDTTDKYHFRNILFDVPALEAGRWLLVVSEDRVFDKEDALLEIQCTDMKIVSMGNRTLFQLVGAADGEPIRNQQVEFYTKKNNQYELISSTQTDNDGRFRYEDRGHVRYWIKIVRDGYEYFDDFWSYGRDEENREHIFVHTLSDRPIYRPGDTVHVAAVLCESDGLDGRTLPGDSVAFGLFDPNYELRDSLQTITDDFGVASATFVIPKDALAGLWEMEVHCKHAGEEGAGDIYIPVEEYKQPKFMVSLSTQSSSQQDAGDPSSHSDTQKLAFDSPYTVYGLAQSYSGAKVSGAKVKYIVTRHTSFWRWNHYAPSTEILSDSTVTAADGTFEITFTPLPDSSVELSHKPNFRYEIFAEVTDLNGETHSDWTSVTVGYHNTTLSLSTSGREVSALESVSVSLKDINNRPLAGDVTVSLSRLHLPDTARLIPSVMLNTNLHNTLSRERFRELFPTYVYSAEENEGKYLKSEWDWNTIQHVTADEMQHKVMLPELKSGYYRVVATCGEETDTQYVRLTLPDERRVQSSNLLWADVTNTSAQPGDRITLRYASAFEDVRFFYILSGPDGEERDSRWLPASRKIKSFSIPVDSAMLGGFTINLFAVKDDVVQKWGKRIQVPFLHKQLKVDITTFRDKLQPGEQEEWIIKVESKRDACGISGRAGEAAERKVESGSLSHSAALIMTMFDDALSSYSYGNFWSYVSPWRYGRSYDTYWLTFSSRFSYYQTPYKTAIGNDPAVTCWRIDSEFLNFMSYRKNKWNVVSIGVEEEVDVFSASTARGESGMAKSAVLNEVAIVDEKVPVIEVGAPESGQRITSEDIAHMPGNSVEEIVAAVGGIGYSDGSQHEPVQVRSNLSTLAFFVADLRTDSTGTAIYRFRVPDLLTRWRLRGMAFTNDLKIGNLDRSLVTQKPLMVQPNIPRFLRHGDSLVLMAKVMNLTDDERKVRVLFSLNNQNTPMILKEQMVTVPAQGSAQVTFPIADLPTDLYVATYEITAQTIDGNDTLATYSDGERGEIPVVSSRQAVTLSQPLYINGKGEKTFHFPLSTFHSSTTAEPHLLAAELTTNPIWLAVKSMPYLKEQENPSTLYLANSLYVNTLANIILEKLDIIEMLGKLADTANTRLKINDDIKQTLLEATPWLRDAQSEVEQRQALANYFDSATLNSQLSILNSQLIERQNADGGWSWMPDGESSTWVTMQVLKRLSILKQSDNQAIKQSLAYVDREEQRYYEKYIKPYIKKYHWQPDNIDYLYTRSFYGKGKTEAYKFYYKNALKNYKSYNGLYTQAQLALIFQRYGDKKAARDLIRRLKEKSLVSDEMGMYWRDNRSGWWWYERPIETQALLIQAFREVTPQDTASIGLMQQWLLKQKQATHWGNDRATVEAISALMPQNTQNIPSIQNNPVSLIVFGSPLTAPSEGLEGYRSQRWTGAALDTLLTHDSEIITLKKETPGIAWGAVYFQYTDDMDKIPSSESGITLKRTYIHEGPWKVGDRVKVRIDISVDRNMEYLELIDGRPSCVEPLSTRSGWNWNQGLRYYVEVKNTATHCYINRLEKGKYVVEYEVYVTNPGTFLAGPVTLQCMYAPEFRATAPAQRLKVD